MIEASLKISINVLVQNAKKETNMHISDTQFTMYKLEGRSYCFEVQARC